MKKNEISIKISLVGAELTGKTILLKYLNNDRLNKAEYEIYKPTNGASYMFKKYIMNCHFCNNFLKYMLQNFSILHY